MSRPKRVTDTTYIGFGGYSLTVCTLDRRPHFVSAEIVDLVLPQFLSVADDERFAIPASCFMSDHVHLLLNALDERSDLEAFAKMAKQRSGYTFKQKFGIRLWQDGYVDRVLRSDESIDSVALYIIQNPVRGGLAKDVLEYPFWGSGTMSRERLLQEIAGGTSSGGSRV